MFKKKINRYFTFSCYLYIVLLISIFFLWIFIPIFLYDFPSPGSTIIYDRNHNLITNISDQDGYMIPVNVEKYDSLYSIRIIRDLLTIEDKRFLDHLGIDLLAKIRSIYLNISLKTKIGWSTLTEQLVKNTYFPNSERNLIQKVRESILSIFFSLFFSKETILEKYINTVYFWNNIYGLQTASVTYFDKYDLWLLTDEEIVILLTLIHNPSTDFSQENPSQYFSTVRNRLWYNFISTISQLKKHKNYDIFPFITQKSREICSGIHYDVVFFIELDCEKWIFRSTIDANLWQFTRNKMWENIQKLSDKNVTNAAIFWVNPQTLEVLIYEWSRGFYAKNIDWQVDVIQSPRQPGSSVKPFLYLLALKNNIAPDNLLVDINQEYSTYKPGFSYTSENYSLKEYWLVRLKESLWNSFNNSSVRLAQHLWLNQVYNFYKIHWFQLDKPPEFYWYSLVLWNASIKLYDLVMSYVELVPKPELDGNINAEKFLLYDILSDPDNRDVSFWVNSILNTSILQAVKTGTSSNFRDNTVVSYSPDIVLGVWFWNNDNSPMIWVSGVSWAGKTWHAIIEYMIQRCYIQNKSIKIPELISLTEYCLDTHCLRKELNYMKKWNIFYSAIRDNIFDHRDIIDTLNAFDREKLKNLNFHIR